MISHVSCFLAIAGHVGGVYFFSKKKDPQPEGKPAGHDVDPSLLCKFVVDGAGKRLGESVSVQDDILIIKSGSSFLGVPLKHVESMEKTLMVKGLVDFTKAYELGEKWRKDSYREMTSYEKPENHSG